MAKSLAGGPGCVGEGDQVQLRARVPTSEEEFGAILRSFALRPVGGLW